LLVKIVDPAGIVIGVDAPPMRAAQFRKELTEKRGVFCVLFDALSCSQGGFVRSPGSSSLHQLVSGWKVTTQTVMQGAWKGSEIATTTVRKSGNPNEILFTLYFRHVNNRWALANIEYE
jgi:hypothetical protein